MTCEATVDRQVIHGFVPQVSLPNKMAAVIGLFELLSQRRHLTAVVLEALPRQRHYTQMHYTQLHYIRLHYIRLHHCDQQVNAAERVPLQSALTLRGRKSEHRLPPSGCAVEMWFGNPVKIQSHTPHTVNRGGGQLNGQQASESREGHGVAHVQ